MNWQPLSEWKADNFFRSVVFRFPAQRPFEAVVDFMTVEEPDAPTRLKLICSTGYHAGQTEFVFPREAAHPNGGVSVAWVKANWQQWIYSECDVSAVRFIKEYPSNF